MGRRGRPGGPRARRGFTLLEMLIVAAVVALIAGVVAVGIASTSRAAAQTRVIREVVTALGAARVQAMAQGRSVEVSFGVVEDRAVLSAGGRERSWRVEGMRAVARGGAGERLRAEFDRAGRADEREWVIEGVDAPGPGARRATRIWRVFFDPITGAVSASAEGPRGSGG